MQYLCSINYLKPQPTTEMKTKSTTQNVQGKGIVAIIKNTVHNKAYAGLVLGVRTMGKHCAELEAPTTILNHPLHRGLVIENCDLEFVYPS